MTSRERVLGMIEGRARELHGPDVSGILVPARDADALAAAMVRFVREELGPRLSAGAAHRRAVFTPEAHARRVLFRDGGWPLDERSEEEHHRGHARCRRRAAG